MRPPKCDLCGKRFDPPEGGAVRFSDYRPLPDGRVGHPEGVLWFCRRHIASAERRSDQTANRALRALRLRAPLARLRGLLRPGA